MRRLAALVLILALLLLAAAAWARITYRPRRQIDLATLVRVIEDQPQSLVPRTLYDWTPGIYGEIEGGVLPSTSAGALAPADPTCPRVRFWVNTTRAEGLDVRTLLRKRGVSYRLDNPNGLFFGEGFLHRALFKCGLFGVLVALVIYGWAKLQARRR